jgi:hypothetical protein
MDVYSIRMTTTLSRPDTAPVRLSRRAARKAARRALEDRLARVDAEVGSFLDAVDAR